MEVDGEEDEDEDEDEEDVEMGDGSDDEAPRPRRKKGKKKARKSELNLEALTNEAAALGAMNENQHMQVKLQKKYCLDALEFIRLVEEGMKTIQRLLASKSIAEALEAMEFFRIAHEYKLDGADAGIKKMLHLIWAKDNNSTSEDGRELKSVRARVLECYKSLYFEPLQNLDGKHNVNRIARNMIESVVRSLTCALTDNIILGSRTTRPSRS